MSNPGQLLVQQVTAKAAKAANRKKRGAASKRSSQQAEQSDSPQPSADLMALKPANASLNQTVTGHTSWDVVNKKEFSNTGKALKASLPQQIEIVATPQNARAPSVVHGGYSTGLPHMNAN